MLDSNPAKVGVDNPTRRRKEQRPFESWAELEALAEAIGPRYGPMILFAAATGLRPAEWIALEMPLQARALEALDRTRDRNGSPLVFPGERGGYLDIHHFRAFQWRPAQKAAGIDPLRRGYDLPPTFATFALPAGISTL